MVYENNLPKTETVYEIKNEVPTFEEFMKTYQEDEGANNSYYYEIDSHGDIRVIRPYGPGLAAGGATIAENVVDDPDAKKVFGFVSDCGVGIATGGAIGAVAQGAGAVLGASEVAGLGSSAGEKAAIEAFKKTGSVSFAGTSHFLAAAKHGIKVVGDIEKVVSFLKDLGFTANEAREHVDHVRDGYDYKS
ncbi:5516_t:CDS:2 [Paraglomus occultum]|uniref:5516_t:CDS:1 n=1 Tax=Paraglomus occultum TaxID=144539 RepID=A0A9N9FQJ7_9GLOM|nr:5516_t:CDS:2 [Paraglomus occultum]